MINELKQLGLSNYESKIISILVNEKLSIRNLSKRSEIPFGKIYSVIKNLKEKNIISETNSRPKLVYIENSSEVVAKLIKQKQEIEKNIFQKLREIAIRLDNDKRKESKFLEIGTSPWDNRRIQLRSFNEAEDQVLQILNIHHKPQTNRGSKTIWERAIVNAIKRGVVFKTIYPINCNIPKILEQINQERPDNFQIKRYSTDFVRCDIIDGKKVLLKLVQQDPLQFGGVIFIENEKLAENLINIFNDMWDQED